MDLRQGMAFVYIFKLRDGVVRSDPLVKVYDLRMMKALPAVHYNLGPSFLKILPTFPSLLYSCTKSGQFQLTDINTSQHSIWDQVNYYLIKQ